MINHSTNSDQPGAASRFLHGFRHVFDPMLCLLIAVLLVRTFLVQGYLISTGSMAPHYYGSHKLATCSNCGFQFAVGLEFDKQLDRPAIDFTDWAVCPNCLADDAELTDLSVNRGDHLLVWKNAYEFRDPHRWEIVVFQNPNEPDSTYIKRIAGLPGETIELHAGNVWIERELARKPLAIQRAMRIPVFDSTFAPQPDETWSPRWTADREPSGWTQSEGGWNFAPTELDGDDELTYRHTLRFGGTQKTVVSLARPASPQVVAAFQEKSAAFPFSPEPAFPGLRYDEQSNSLIATGVIPGIIQNQLRPLDPSPGFQAALDEVIEKSRYAPVTDFYAYNHQSVRIREHPVSEFYLEAHLRPQHRNGTIALSLSAPDGEYFCELDLEHSRVRLVDVQSGATLREAALSIGDSNDLHVELSSFDRQISVGVDGIEPFAPWELNPHLDDRPMPLEIAKIAGTIPFEVTSVKLYRDVFYTSEPSDRGVGRPFSIPEDEYFLLGDNSPVSSDSRRWAISTVPRRLLIGKPFLVHLPSTQERLVWRGREFRYRQPDFSRIRFVR